MKTLFTLLLASVFTSAFAYDEGKLTITVASGKNVQVFIDGRSYQENEDTYLINNVQPGNHAIKIYRRSRSINDRNNRNDRRNAYELIYSSTIYVKPSYHVDVMINRFGKAMVDERALSDRNGRWNEDDWNHGNYNDGGYTDSYRQAMRTYDFDQLVNRVKSQRFSSGKLNSATDAIPANYFNTSQIRQLLQLFSSDSDKLEVAKLAYRRTLNARNYYTLYDVFSFQSSREELDRYIKAYRY